jgi:hypothetical protein
MEKNENELKWALSGDGTHTNTVTLSEDGTLTVSGNGAMPDFYYEGKIHDKDVNLPPWEPYRDNITKVVIEDGVQHIGTFSFYRCNNLTSVIIGKSVTSIGREAFDLCTGLTEIVNYQEIPQEIYEITYGSEVFGVFGHIFKYRCTLSVPAGSIERYRSAAGWKGFYKMGVIGDPGSVKIEGEWKGQTEGGEWKTITWTLSDEGTLTFGGADCFAGSGSPMSRWYYMLPWAYFENSITQIEISEEIEEIGRYVFAGCGGTKKFVNYREIPQTVAEMTFWDINRATCTLSVPESSVEAYRTAAGWKDFINIEAIGAK